MTRTPALLGTKVRALRRRVSLSQARLASELGISASYLNLIEHDRRPLTAPLLIKLAQRFDLDLARFAAEDDASLGDDVVALLCDPLFESHALTNVEVKDFVASSPQMARALCSLYRAYRDAHESAQQLAGRAAGGATDEPWSESDPSEEVSDLIQRNHSYFPGLEACAEELRRSGRLNQATLYADLADHLERKHRVVVRVGPAASLGTAIRRYDPGRLLLELSESLPAHARTFQLAHQLALLEHGTELDTVLDEQSITEDGRPLARVVLANYLAGALVMPYDDFLTATREVRYDIEALCERFGASFESVCHRLAGLRKPAAEGVPLHMVRVDIAGNVSKRFSGSGMGLPRFGSGCPRWDVYQAFLSPGQIRIQVSEMPDGKQYFCVAKAIRKGSGRFGAPATMQSIGIGCLLEHASHFVYADGMDLDAPQPIIPIGTSCRVCERLDCAQRAFASIQHPLRVDPNIRGVSPFAPTDSPEETGRGR